MTDARGSLRAMVPDDAQHEPVPQSPAAKLMAHLSALLAIALAAAVSSFWRGDVSFADIAMIHVLAIAAVAMRLGRGPSLLASVLAVASYDFFFVPPFFTFHVTDHRHLVTFAVMLGAGVAIATLTDRIRAQSRAAAASAIERARLAAEIDAQLARAEIEALRSSLLSSVSHDLRTPLAVITGAASTLLDDEARIPASDRRELIASITEEAARIERLVANVLEMSRLESRDASGTTIATEKIPIEEIIGSALTRMEPMLEGRTISTRLPEVVWRVAVNPVLFEQVLVNLLDNAAKHTPPGGPIDVAVEACDGSLTIDVADRGPGIAVGSAPGIFEKFQRGPSAAPGVGLGLAICRGIVDAHRGRIEALPREGGGTTFRVHLRTADRGVELSADDALEAG